MLPHKRHARHKVETLAESFILLDSLLLMLVTIPDKEKALLAIPDRCRQNYRTLPHKFICGTSRSDKILLNN